MRIGEWMHAKNTHKRAYPILYRHKSSKFLHFFFN